MHGPWIEPQEDGTRIRSSCGFIYKFCLITINDCLLRENKSACVTTRKCIKTSCFRSFILFEKEYEARLFLSLFALNKKRLFVVQQEMAFSCMLWIHHINISFNILHRARTKMRFRFVSIKISPRLWTILNACYRIHKEPKVKYCKIQLLLLLQLHGIYLNTKGEIFDFLNTSFQGTMKRHPFS